MAKTETLEFRINATFDDSFPILITKAEHDALKQAVEVLEDQVEQAAEDAASEIAWLKDYNGILASIAHEEGEAYDAAREAVEVLEGIDKTALIDSLRREISEAKENADHWLTSFVYKINAFAELDEAAREAVEILEDMYEQRDASSEKWYGRWMEEYSDHHDTRAALADAEAQADNYAARLKDTDEAYPKLSVTADYRGENLTRLRERIKTYRATLQEIALGGLFADGLSRLARHVLTSEIHDGGSDF